LLDQAVSSTPQINKLVQDIETAASASGIIVTQINISKIDLKDKAVRTSKNVLTVNIATHTGFKEARVFVDSLISGRRLKTLKSITLDRNEKGSSSSAELDIKIDLEGYYL